MSHSRTDRLVDDEVGRPLSTPVAAMPALGCCVGRRDCCVAYGLEVEKGSDGILRPLSIHQGFGYSAS